MRIVTLGTGTGAPVPERGMAGVYVNVAGEHVVLDCGPGTMRSLAEIGVTYLDIDRVFITHFHPDHCAGLIEMLFAMRIPEPTRTKTLTIYGPQGITRLYRRLNTAFHRALTPKTYKLLFQEIGEIRLRFRGFRVASRRMRHSRGALGYRIESSRRSVAYSGDTDCCCGITELGSRADLLIVECSLPDRYKVKGHLTPTECGEIAADAGCRHLVLTHFYPIVNLALARRQVRKNFRGRLTLARDLDTFSV